MGGEIKEEEQCAAPALACDSAIELEIGDSSVRFLVEAAKMAEHRRHDLNDQLAGPRLPAEADSRECGCSFRT